MVYDHPKADSYTLAFCGDPQCGLHLTAQIDGDDVIEIVLSAAQTLDLIKTCQDALTKKGARK
jgi:hypothetical protein